MIMRRRPLLRAAAVAGGAYIAGKKAQDRRAGEQAYAEQDAGASEAVPQQAARPATPGTAAGPATKSVSDQVSELTKLHDQGMLTDDEFTAAKAKVLGI
jgi:putative oligomerization/nucleic acid binding protein